MMVAGSYMEIAGLVLALLGNAAVVTALILFVTSLEPPLRRSHPALSPLLIGACFGIIAVASMTVPVITLNDARLDLRAVPLLLVGPFQGVVASVVAGAISLAARFVLGGPRLDLGLSTIFSVWAGSMVLAFVRGWRLNGSRAGVRPLRFRAIVGMALLLPVLGVVPSYVSEVLRGNIDAMFWPATLALWSFSAPVALFNGAMMLRDEQRSGLANSLSETRALLQALAEKIPGILFRARLQPDGAFTFSFVSARSTDIVGLSPQTLTAAPNPMALLLHPEDRTRIMATIHQIGEDWQVPPAMEYRVLRPDGNTVWLQSIASLNPEASQNEGALIIDGVAVDVTERHASEERVRAAHDRANWLASHDLLTQLPNRQALLQQIGEKIAAASGGGRVGLVIFDLRESRMVNELFGQGAGDSRLIHAARVLTEAAPSDAVVARTGSDDFGILLPNLANEVTLEAISIRLAVALQAPYLIADQAVPLRAHGGFAMSPADAGDADRLLQVAAIALEAAREADSDMPVRFSAAIEQRRNDRRLLDQELEQALERGDLTLVWQPVVRCTDRAVLGHEVLVRWQRPDGPVSPEMFVARAEATGLWGRLDSYVLRRACRMAAAHGGGGWIAVNVSAAWFRVGDLVSLVRTILAETGLAADRLWLEITERVLIEERARAIEVIGALRAMNVSVAIDDFGALYSSLGYLYALPIQKIKLDRSFIDHIDTRLRARTVVGAMLGLCRELGVEVVAEGVETESQLALLTRLGCPAVQGYLTGRPASEPVPVAPLQGTGANKAP